jgi:hypothetical protein
MVFFVGSFVFDSRAAFRRKAKEVLNSEVSGTLISGEHHDFLDAIFSARPDKVALLDGRKRVAYWRKVHKFRTVSFHAELDDGALLDFSYMKV